jgi:hypothetical protein
VAATSAGSEVDALDPAGYGPITITQAITIEGQGWSYIAPPAGGNGITINAVSGNVAIHGVSLNGVGITGTTTGIQFNSGGSLNVQDCVIRNFANYGIAFLPSASSTLSVSNTLVSANGSTGIYIVPTGSGTTLGVLDHVEMKNNIDALDVISEGQTTNVTVSDSVIANNADGIGVIFYSGPVNIMVRNSTIANNVATNAFNGYGLVASNSGATVWVTRSTITGNTTGWSPQFSSTVTSYGDNNVIGNVTNGTPTSTLGTLGGYQ